MPSPDPFRSEDLQTRIDALRAERQALLDELHRVRRELAAQRPWLWGKFFLGLVLPILIAFVASLWFAR